MKIKATCLIFTFYSIFILFIIPSNSAQSCQPMSCHTETGPIIRFPFRIRDRQHMFCGYPGFELDCNDQNQTIINLPQSGEFIVDDIDYTRQALFINNPDSCFPNRIMNFSLSGSPFIGNNLRDYTFLNCSSGWMEYSSSRLMPLFCLSGRNYSVLAMNSHFPEAQVPATCQRIANVSVPMQWAATVFYWSSMDMSDQDLELVWTTPNCRNCENRGGSCGYTGPNLQTGCSRRSRSGISRTLGITLGVGIPGLMCILGLVCYYYGLMLNRLRNRNRLNSGLPTTAVSNQRLAVRFPSGLDAPTIESYPKTVLGDSGRLPKPNDVTCSICLADYQPTETLRTIPECKHYFHADCIDEWLKLNGTCPVCRNSPKSANLSTTPSSATPSSSMSVSSSESGRSTDP